MKKMHVNFGVDAAMLASFLACGATGVAKMPDLALPFDMDTYTILSLVHDWTGVAGLVLAVVHLVLHAPWIKAASRSIFLRTGTTRSGREQVGPDAVPVPTVTPAKVRRTVPVRMAGSVMALVLAAGIFLVASPAPVAAYGHFSHATVPQGISYAEGSLKDGTWTGTATGYRPGLQVQVTVKDGKINDVKIADNNETPRYLQTPSSRIPSRVVQTQSTKVDTVAGATMSSQGILSAVENALASARK